MTTPVRLLLTTQSDQTSKYTTSVSGCPDDDPHLTLCLWGKKELSFIPLGALRKFGLNNELLKRDTAGEATSALFKSVCGRTNLDLYIIFIQVGHRREWRTTRFSHTRPVTSRLARHWGQRSGQRSGHSKNARLGLKRRFIGGRQRRPLPACSRVPPHSGGKAPGTCKGTGLRHTPIPGRRAFLEF